MQQTFVEDPSGTVLGARKPAVSKRGKNPSWQTRVSEGKRRKGVRERREEGKKGKRKEIQELEGHLGGNEHTQHSDLGF